MRRVLVAAAAALIILRADAAQDLVLKSGETIRASKVVEKGRQLIVTTTDGRLLSVAASDVDREKTAAARAAAAAPAASPAVAAKPRSIADVASARKDRKAMVVLTDGDVSQVLENTEGEAAQGVLDVAGANAVKTPLGYSVTGSLVNSGQGEVLGPGVRIEGIGANGSVVVSASASGDKAKLDGGQSASFKADIATTETVNSFRYVPQWQATMAVKKLEPSDGAAPEAAAPAPATPAATTPRATPVPRPDMPAPPPKYPVGSPTTPGGVYVPATSKDGQPKPPGS